MNLNPEPKTPAMHQHMVIKKKHPGKILFFQMGDFFEIFGEDAKIAAKVLNIQLTSRHKNQKDAVVMCGFPIHSHETHLKKLISSGHKVAICRQVESAKDAKGVVRREVVRTVTPGSYVTDEQYESTLAAIFFQTDPPAWGIAFGDLALGEIHFEQLYINNKARAFELIYLSQPNEILCQIAVNPQQEEWAQEIKNFLKDFEEQRGQKVLQEWQDPKQSSPDKYKKLLLDHFKAQSLEVFDLEQKPACTCAVGALLDYWKTTQQDELVHLDRIRNQEQKANMVLDETTIRNLEIFTQLDGSKNRFSLFYLLNRCQTPMGTRLLKYWLQQPLVDLKQIEERHAVITEMVEHSDWLRKLIHSLHGLGDLDRVIAKISMPATRLYDFQRLQQALAQLPAVRQAASYFQANLVQQQLADYDELEDLKQTLNQTLEADSSIWKSNGLLENGFIASGVNAELDSIRKQNHSSKEWLAGYETAEKEKTSIQNLKIKYNRVFGYYIEIPNSNKKPVPEHYIRKQTLVNAERYFTVELKDFEENILLGEGKASEIEQQIFANLRQKTQAQIPRLRNTIKTIEFLDALSSLAHLALEQDYTKPQLQNEKYQQTISITQGRHPVLETVDTSFIPNDLQLDSDNKFLMLITGPNMGGKSTFMRQVALISLLAQIGSFVPAKQAILPVFNRIFTRVGASDNLARGKSTFMVEMSETASILHQATSHSLIILDEIGRGTSTLDGISLASAIIEYLHQLKPIVLFATHYYELTALSQKLAGVENCNVAVKEEQGKMVFLRKMQKGSTDKSYGIQVAELAGLPKAVIGHAKQVLNTLSGPAVPVKLSVPKNLPPALPALPVAEKPAEKPTAWQQELMDLDLNNQTPLQALDFLVKLQQDVKKTFDS